MPPGASAKPKAKPKAKDWNRAKAGKRFYVVLPDDVLAQVEKEARQLGSQRSAAQHVVIARLRASFQTDPVKDLLPHG